MTSEDVVESFEADGMVLHNFRNAIGTLKNIRISNDKEHPLRRTFDESASSFEHSNARTLGADQGASHIEIVFWKQLIQVVARDAARDVGKALADLIGVGSGESLELVVDVGAASTVSRDVVQNLPEKLTRLSSERRRR